VAKKSKIDKEKKANRKAAEAIARDGETQTGALAAASKPGRKKASPKKMTARASKPAAAKKAPVAASIHEPSDEAIRIRAYFIAERRVQLSLEGDSTHDWIEARRQLVEEARQKAS
jgi:hypothetical protein